MTIEEVLQVARQGREQGCTEALFTLGTRTHTGEVAPAKALLLVLHTVNRVMSWLEKEASLVCASLCAQVTNQSCVGPRLRQSCHRWATAVH